MNKQKSIYFAAALVMMVSTAIWIGRAKSHVVYEPPGVKVVQTPLLGPDSKFVRPQSIFMPTNIPGLQATLLPITQTEMDGLPADTTFGRCQYVFADHQSVTLTAILMGTDRSSIHQPQYCLKGQGWAIDLTETVRLKIQSSRPYELDAVKLTTSINLTQPDHPPMLLHGVYVYWFVSNDHLTPQLSDRLWNQAVTWLTSGKMQRWAYVSLFCACLPGEEEEALKRITQVAGAAVPEFQTAGETAVNKIK
jgi:hypothetical protein